MLGVCYYPEHWPEDAWRDDAAAMRAMGITYVRIGEFAWSRLEPEPDSFDFAWLDRALAVLGGAGLRVVLCTPTATPPKWLIDRHPDILPVDAQGRARGFGGRRHSSFLLARVVGAEPAHRDRAGRALRCASGGGRLAGGQRVRLP